MGVFEAFIIIIIIEALQNIITIPDSIDLVLVDYTYSSDFDFIKKKFIKDYQSENRLLIIVLLGQKSDSTMRDINDDLQLAIRQDDGSNHLENIKIITLDEYREFLGFDEIIDENFETIFKLYQIYSQLIFSSKNVLYDAIRRSTQANSWLQDRNEDWIRTYL